MMGIPSRFEFSIALICLVASYPSMIGIWMSIKIKSYWPTSAFSTLSTATTPSSATSMKNPASCKISTAISWFNSLSSTRRIFFPSKHALPPQAASPATRAVNGDSKMSLSSDKKIGFEQNAVTPAFLASSSMSDQSYAVRMMMGFSFPMIPRMRLTTSTPFMSGISQSMMYAAYSSFCSPASLARSTASFPEVVQSGRMPMMDNILVTLEQVLKSSSATSAEDP